MVNLNYVFGEQLGQYSGAHQVHQELDEMQSEFGEFTVRVVEVCTDYGWNHAASSFLLGDGVKRRPPRAKKPSRTSMADARRPPKNTKKTTKKSGWRRFFTWFGITVLVLMLAGAGVLEFAYATVKLPDPQRRLQTNTSFVYFNDGKRSWAATRFRTGRPWPTKTFRRT